QTAVSRLAAVRRRADVNDERRSLALPGQLDQVTHALDVGLPRVAIGGEGRVRRAVNDRVHLAGDRCRILGGESPAGQGDVTGDRLDVGGRCKGTSAALVTLPETVRGAFTLARPNQAPDCAPGAV